MHCFSVPIFLTFERSSQELPKPAFRAHFLGDPTLPVHVPIPLPIPFVS